MKNTICLLAAVCLANLAPAQTNRYPLKPEHVTVFLKGAEIYGKTKVNLVKGENEVVLTGLARHVDESSVMVNAGSDVTILSVTFLTNYADTLAPTNAVKALKDSIKRVQANKKVLSNKSKAIAGQLSVLAENQRVNGANQSVSTAELKKLLDFMRTEAEGLLSDKDKVDEELAVVNDRLRSLQDQLQEEQTSGENVTGKLVVKLQAKETKATTVTANYITRNAGWMPVYDVIADQVGQPLKMVYKANVSQSTGTSWNNVYLSLSTGNPQEGMEVPVVEPRYLSFYEPSIKRKAMLYNSSQTGEDVFTTEKYMNAGYSGALNFSQSEGDLAADKPTGVSKSKAGKGIAEHVAIDNAGVNTAFEIDMPYTVPSDDQNHLVSVALYNVPATYQYFAAPETDEDAFLVARVDKWQDLNLLAGKTNIFYENAYIGQGAIDPKNISDTMDISLGRDKKIVIKRERDKLLRSRKVIGANVREQYAYTITIHNTRKEPVTITIADQVPVSNDKDITVEDVNIDNAQLTEKTGLLKWTLMLQPGETKTIKFGYALKYPRGKTLENEPD